MQNSVALSQSCDCFRQPLMARVDNVQKPFMSKIFVFPKVLECKPYLEIIARYFRGFQRLYFDQF